ncbi:Uncharacterised protein [Mycobacteroides abscessus subsp. abscessus]|nr:Uncharacterised protein [Mycobacteroides abscessus subsp. abscessus]
MTVGPPASNTAASSPDPTTMSPDVAVVAAEVNSEMSARSPRSPTVTSAGWVWSGVVAFSSPPATVNSSSAPRLFVSVRALAALW